MAKEITRELIITQGTAVKKPVQINWFQWTGDIDELEEWHSLVSAKSFEDDFLLDDKGLRVKTLEGHSYEVPNNYIIIQGTANEFYPHEYQLFKTNYDIKE